MLDQFRPLSQKVQVMGKGLNPRFGCAAEGISEQEASEVSDSPLENGAGFAAMSPARPERRKPPAVRWLKIIRRLLLANA